MSAANFKSMADFPLVVANDSYCKICPECGLTNDKNADVCDCGCDITNVEAVYDEWTSMDIASEMGKVAQSLNERQDFYTVSVESGYYSGMQFYVEDKYCNIDEWDNEDAQGEFGICRSEMIRRYRVAGNLIRRGLEKAKNDLGLMELAVTARFSNGEVWYTEDKPDMLIRARLKVAANAA